MKRLLMGVMIICFVLGSVLPFAGCSSTKEVHANVIGVWKVESYPYYLTMCMYMYIYSDGTGDFYGHEFNNKANIYHGNSFEWSCSGDVFQIDGRADKFTVKDGKMYDKQGKVQYTLVSTNTSVDIPII